MVAITPLSVEDMAKIRKLHGCGTSKRDLMKMFDIGSNRLYRILRDDDYVTAEKLFKENKDKGEIDLTLLAEQCENHLALLEKFHPEGAAVHEYNIGADHNGRIHAARFRAAVPAQIRSLGSSIPVSEVA